MTREEAISLYWNIRYDVLNSKKKEALDVAFDALREQEERSKGCEACVPNISDDFWPEQLLIGSPKAGLFCPMCGRKLEEDA